MNILIKPSEVAEIFNYCLITKESYVKDPRQPFKSAEGIFWSASFNKARLLEKEPKIHEILKELPVELQEGGGEGDSFLWIRKDKKGGTWTSSLRLMEQLLLLGLATGKIQYVLKRKAWGIFKLGIPHIVVMK